MNRHRFTLCWCDDGKHEYPDHAGWHTDEMSARRDAVFYPPDAGQHIVRETTTREVAA